MKTDVLIIGAGPSGLAAAYEVGRAGLSVTIIDEQFHVGGRLKNQVQYIDNIPFLTNKLRGFELVNHLLNRIKPFNVKLLLGHAAIGVYKDGTIGVTNRKETFPIYAEKIIVCTGVSDEPVLFQGWTLPGIITVDATLCLLNREWVVPGKSAIIIGSTDLALETAAQLHDLGVNVKGVVEQGDTILARVQKCITQVVERKIPILLHTKLLKALGNKKVEILQFSVNGEEMKMDIDFICTSGGYSPVTELLELLGCELTNIQLLGGWVPLYTAHLQTSHSSVFTAGSVTGNSTQASDILSGQLAGISVAEVLGRITNMEATEKKETIWNQIYQIERESYLDVWNTRMEMVKGYRKTTTILQKLNLECLERRA
jgi:sarcosine oxidase subunit alpha